MVYELYLTSMKKTKIKKTFPNSFIHSNSQLFTFSFYLTDKNKKKKVLIFCIHYKKISSKLFFKYLNL